jgi:hypothetical protein
LASCARAAVASGDAAGRHPRPDDFPDFIKLAGEILDTRARDVV